MDEERKAEQKAREFTARQSRRFDAALRQGKAFGRSDRDLSAQSGNYALAAAAGRQKELAARQVLMRHGLFPSQFMPYFRFVRHLGAATRLYWADDFRLVAEAASARWAGQGCDRKILAEILYQVFNVSIEDKSEARSQNDEAGADLTTKTQRHQEEDGKPG